LLTAVVIESDSWSAAVELALFFVLIVETASTDALGIPLNSSMTMAVEYVPPTTVTAGPVSPPVATRQNVETIDFVVVYTGAPGVPPAGPAVHPAGVVQEVAVASAVFWVTPMTSRFPLVGACP